MEGMAATTIRPGSNWRYERDREKPKAELQPREHSLPLLGRKPEQGAGVVGVRVVKRAGSDGVRRPVRGRSIETSLAKMNLRDGHPYFGPARKSGLFEDV